MSRVKWHDVRKVLQQEFHTPATRSEGDFWSDFRVRAELGPGPEGKAVASPGVIPRRFGWVLAVCIVLAVVVTSLMIHKRTSGPGEMTALRSEVEEIEIFVPYTSVMIVQDAESGGSVVWLADLNPEESLDKGGT